MKTKDKIVEYEIEHHFEEKNLLPKEEQVDYKVKIIKIKEKGEFFFENGIGKDKGKVVINCGPLSIKLDKIDFNKILSNFKTS